MPAALRASLVLPAGWAFSEAAQGALGFTVSTGAGGVEWVYTLVAPFPTVTDGINAADLKTSWLTAPPPSAPFDRLLVDSSTLAVFTELWGKPGQAVEVLPAGQLLSTAWERRSAWAIVPFEQLHPRWKVIALDGQNPLWKSFVAQTYPLTVHFDFNGDPAAAESARSQMQIPSTNRDPNKLTTVVVTGVTALVRGTAALMESRGMTYPARDIGDILREADILHINNEVPFAKNCPSPYPWSGLVFCSQPRYIELMDAIGTDVVDLSGDHFADWGPEAMLFTLDLYRQRGWKIYGGGLNDAEAKRPALFEHNGNKIAFLGCNYKEPGYATASPTTPGAIHCNPDWLYPAVKQVQADGYLPIVTFQHLEYYEYIARPRLQEDFRGVADAGAVIVSGSQAHQPHALEFRDGATLHYGLGNLFFDQVNTDAATAQAFIDRHVIYDNRYLSTELISIQFVDYARARLQTPAERTELLKTVFKASGW